MLEKIRRSMQALTIGAVVIAATATAAAAVFNTPTTSSPIAISANDQLVWSVNAENNTVSVIRSDTTNTAKNANVKAIPATVATCLVKRLTIAQPNRTAAITIRPMGSSRPAMLGLIGTRQGRGASGRL